MTKRLNSAQKKKRLVQLRDAQRRRRARLRDESQRFVQIIIPADLLERLRLQAEQTGETVQQHIGRIVAQAAPAQNVDEVEEKPSESSGQPPPLENDESATDSHIVETMQDFVPEPVFEPAMPEHRETAFATNSHEEPDENPPEPAAPPVVVVDKSSGNHHPLDRLNKDQLDLFG